MTTGDHNNTGQPAAEQTPPPVARYDRAFAAAFDLRPPRCLGRRLQPFALGHYAALQAIEHPALDPDRDIAVGHLASAVWICAAPDPLAIPDISQRAIRRWANRWASARAPRLWRRQRDWTVQRDIFLLYIRDYIAMPRLWPGEETARSPVPWAWTLAVTLMQRLNFSQTAAWRCPVNRAILYSAVAAETAGHETFINAADAARIDAAESGIPLGRPVRARPASPSSSSASPSSSSPSPSPPSSSPASAPPPGQPA